MKKNAGNISFKIVVFTALVGIVFLLYWQRGQGLERFEDSRFALGTLCTITLVTDQTEQQAKALFEDGFAEIDRLDRVFSRYRDDSEVAKINQSRESRIPVSSELFTVLQQGQKIQEETDGAFDVRTLPLTHFWKERERLKQWPSDQEIQNVVKQVQGAKVELLQQEKVLLKNSRLSLDLGGIAKGYIIGRVADVLKDKGIANAMINIGGDVYAMGVTEHQKPWRVGIESPENPGFILKAISLLNRAVVTSGDYQRFFQIDGRKYSHIFDPRTGRPVEGSLSVTLIGEDIVRVDALATAVSVMGPAKAEEFLKDQKKLEYALYFKDNSGNVTEILSPGFK